MNARQIIEAESPKSAFRHFTRAEWIGGGLWYMKRDFGVGGGQRRGQVGHVFYGHDRKWHMRDVMGVSNVEACRAGYNTEEEAKAALTSLALEKGLIREEPLPWQHEAESPKDVFRKAVSVPEHVWHLRTWSHNTFLFQDDEGNILECERKNGWHLTLRDPYAGHPTVSHQIDAPAETNAAIRSAKHWATRIVCHRSGL